MELTKRTLLALLVLSFLLPFVPPGCSDMSGGGKKEESAATSDSASTKIDTIYSQSNIPQTNVDSSSKYQSDTKDSLSIFRRVFVSPDAENLSGTGYLLEYFIKEYFFVFCAFWIPILILIGKVSGFRLFAPADKYLLLTGFIFLTIISILRINNVLWGFWITVSLYFITVLAYFVKRDK